MLTCFVCKNVIVILTMFIQKFKTICNKYAKKTRGCQKKADFTVNLLAGERGGTPNPFICYAFYMTLAF